MKKILLFAVATLALAACDNSGDNPNPSPEAIKITATIGESASSRASETSWAEGDEIGILSCIGTGEQKVEGPYVNLEYKTKNGDGLFTGTSILFKPMTLIAYYPFTGMEGEAPGTNGVISATTDVEAQKNQPMIDFLWDSKTGVENKDFSVTDPNVNFKFTHKMSKLSFTFKGSWPVYDENNQDQMVSDGVDVHTMVSYWIDGLGIEGTFDTSNGVCAINDKRDGLTISFEDEDTKGDDYDYDRSFPSLIVFPQKKPDKGFILHIRTKEGNQLSQDYKCSLGFTDDEIKPGHHYKFTIQVTRRGLIVGKMSIEQWGEAQKFIVATVDGEEEPKEITAENP